MGSVLIAQENREKDCIEKSNKTIKPWYLSVWWELGFVIQFCIDFFFPSQFSDIFLIPTWEEGKKTNIWILRFKLFFVSQKSQLNQRGILWNGAALGEYQNSKDAHHKAQTHSKKSLYLPAFGIIRVWFWGRRWGTGCFPTTYGVWKYSLKLLKQRRSMSAYPKDYWTASFSWFSEVGTDYYHFA